MGKKIKCPKCGHKFKVDVEELEEVEDTRNVASQAEV